VGSVDQGMYVIDLYQIYRNRDLIFGLEHHSLTDSFWIVIGGCLQNFFCGCYKSGPVGRRSISNPTDLGQSWCRLPQTDSGLF
jgi:hypothetical protein